MRDVRLLPKAHLHLHFTGSMRVETVRDLADKHAIRLPDALTTGYQPQLSARDERGWFRFQRLYDAARACVRDESDLRRIVREAAQDDASEGSRWLEIQVDPTSYAPFVGGITPALEIVLDEAAAASREESTQVAVIVAASRIRHPLDARTLARLAAQYAGAGAGTVVDFGLSTLNIISCPSCSRVENEAFIELAEQVKEMTRYAADHAITIAVMGCRVNGPGETDDADLGLWCGPNFVNLKKGSAELGAFAYDQILPRLRTELDLLISQRPLVG